MSDAVSHPTPQELAAFGLGKLPQHAAAAIATHLESCPKCLQAVAGVLPDSFLDKIRAAGPAGSSFPPSLAQPGNAPKSGERPAVPVVPCPNVPPELARHPKYLILRELNRGGMGVVYQARQTVMNRQVVIKVINRALLEQPGALERFRREIQAAAQLSHPNIVTAHDAEQAGDLHMLVMEFVPGQSLAEVLEKKGPLPVAHACHYVRQVALGLQHAHERGMVHRDIKPSNVILMPIPKDRVKILDFGLAKVISEQGASKGLTESGAYMGTPDYCAPEQAEDASKADIRADLYSLGCTLYCLLAGHPPFQEDTMFKIYLAHREKQPQPLPELRKDVPAELWQVVKRLLAKDPAQRYQTPIEVFQALSVFVKPGAKPNAKAGAAPAKGVGSPVKGTKLAGDTKLVKKVLREVPGKSPPKKTPVKDGASPFENLVDTPAPPRKAKRGGESTKRAPMVWSRCWPALAGAGIMLLAMLGLWASDVLKVTVPDGIKNLPERKPDDLGKPITNSIGMKLVLVEPGTFLMGSPKNEVGRSNDEFQHEVKITRPFYMGIYEVTQGQYKRVMKENPSCYSPTGDGKKFVQGMDTQQFPVENVSWHDAEKFCRRLRELPEEMANGRKYRLPTEAEWEYSCRGGHLFQDPSPPFHFGNSLSSRQANFDGRLPYGGAPEGRFLNRTEKVGSYDHNPLGLYDLHGNVREWCADWYKFEYYERSPRQDPQGPEPTDGRVLRGGSWIAWGERCRAAYRSQEAPDARHDTIGFRVVFTVGAKN